MKIKLYQIAFWAAVIAIMALAVTPHGIKFARHDKINHFTAFLVLSFLGDKAFEMPMLSISIYLMGFGLLIEVIQFFLPYRSFSPLDMLANISGIMIYVAIRFCLETFGGKSSVS